MRIKFWIMGLALFAMPMLSGCVTNGGGSTAAVADDNFISESYRAGDQLSAQMDARGAGASTVLYTSFVSISDLESSSQLGQITAEEVSSRLNQNGFQVTETRLRNAMAINEAGEFMLSREVTALAQQHEAAAVLVGTYAEAKNMVLVSTRLVSPDTGRIIASYDYELAKGENAIRLLGEDQSLGQNAEARASVIVIAASMGSIPDIHTAEQVASQHCARRGQVYSLVDRVIDWRRHTSYFRCVDSTLR